MQGKNDFVAALILQGYIPEVRILRHIRMCMHTCQKSGGKLKQAN